MTTYGKILFALFSCTIAILDIKKGEVPRIAFILAFTIFITVYLLQKDILMLFFAIIGAVLGIVIFTLAYFLSGKKLGLADIWYSGIIGLILGPIWLYPAIAAACICGVIWFFITKKRSIPFIPFMAVGSISITILQGWF